ncbi:YibE/F family protein [Clostridium sp. DL-VIII]|uniref:YibE/F family protein n=1 Tax=Clostridium sp. DL-VIII TaxID=641107 RepID=UPI00023AF9DF|nr:YibE/F family protein [Clostridium sp. DL-VIII]EHI99357.1 YibE/F family protein [Clostridium sp. DL-VIII]
MMKKLFNTYIGKLKNIKNNKINKKFFYIGAGLIIIFLFALYFISTNDTLYNKPIAKITSIVEDGSNKETDNGKIEPIKNQKVKAIIMNGTYKGRNIELNNLTSFSQVNDIDLKVNDEVFISIVDNDNKEIISAKILDLKRDKYLVYILSIFIALILLVGGFKGFKSLLSVIINIIILFTVISLFSMGYDLMTLSIIASLFFVIFSIIIVSGKNKKSISAIVGTLIGTFISLLIAGIIINLNNWNGIHFEEMEFLTHPPEKIFFIELIIGTLGGIMDIAISISSAIEELYNKNPDIDTKTIIKSAREIGQDIMGTMANTLVFAYLSGSIPTILLLLRNEIPITYIININLSLEFMRALIGSIGIVLSIPITIFTSILILKKHMIGENIRL